MGKDPVKALILTGLTLMMYYHSATVYAWPWSTDMQNQPGIKPQEPVLSKDGKQLIIFPFPSRSVPVTGSQTKVEDREQANKLVNPVRVTTASLKKGKYLYDIYCSVCHGFTGKADVPLSKKIFASDLTSQRVQHEISEGWVWGTITFGGGIMPAYGVPGAVGGSNDLTAEERWHVVNYVRNGLTKSDLKE